MIATKATIYILLGEGDVGINVTRDGEPGNEIIAIAFNELDETHTPGDHLIKEDTQKLNEDAKKMKDIKNVAAVIGFIDIASIDRLIGNLNNAKKILAELVLGNKK